MEVSRAIHCATAEKTVLFHAGTAYHPIVLSHFDIVPLT